MATNSATNDATNTLKALAGLVLERNSPRNQFATNAEKESNQFTEKKGNWLLSFTEFSDAEIDGKPDALIVTCYTPNNKPIEVEAKDAEHAEWLKRMNPKRGN